MLEQYAYFAEGEDVNVTDHPARLAHFSIPHIRLQYFLAYQFSIEEDLTWPFVPIVGIRELVSYEAGNAYLRLASAEPVIPDTHVVEAVKDGVARLEQLPPSPVFDDI